MERTNLHNEPRLLEWIVVHHDSTSIAQYLIDTSKDHGGHVAPILKPSSQVCLDDQADAVECDECGAGWDRRAIAVHAELDRTHGDGTISGIAIVRVSDPVCRVGIEVVAAHRGKD